MASLNSPPSTASTTQEEEVSNGQMESSLQHTSETPTDEMEGDDTERVVGPNADKAVVALESSSNDTLLEPSRSHHISPDEGRRFIGDSGILSQFQTDSNANPSSPPPFPSENISSNVSEGSSLDQNNWEHSLPSTSLHEETTAIPANAAAVVLRDIIQRLTKGQKMIKTQPTVAAENFVAVS